jgi:hypothetical protein
VESKVLPLRRILLLAVLGLGASAAELRASEVAKSSATEEEVSLKLKVLEAPCELKKRWVGSAFSLPYGAWLDCDGLPILIREPLNLLGHVNVRSPEAALEFVRFFTAPETYELFDLNGMVELRRDDAHWGGDIVEALGLQEVFFEPIVTEAARKGICIDERGRHSECKEKIFAIRRIVVTYDQNVYRVTEEVDQDGFYSLLSQEQLLEDVSKFGILHLGPY